MQHRAPSSRLVGRGPTDADLRRIQSWLRWLTMASVVAVVALSVDGSGWWAAHAYWGFVAMLVLDLVIGVPVELILLWRAWTGRRRSRQAVGDAYDEIIASRRRRGE